MPQRHVILFTWQAYATWMPDRPQGYYRNRDGLRPRAGKMAEHYRVDQRFPTARLINHVQRDLLAECERCASPLSITLYGVATDDSHLHLLAAWDHDRSPEQLQRSIKWSLSRRLNTAHGKRPWFGRNGHDRRVRDLDHFLYLRDAYLPSHPGWKWDKRIGLYREDRSLLHLRSPASRGNAATSLENGIIFDPPVAASPRDAGGNDQPTAPAAARPPDNPCPPARNS